MRDLLVTLPAGMRPRVALEQQLRTAIRSGRLAAGAPLPSSRSLASDLGIARSTVVAAYDQLTIEGYLEARQGRSTTVAFSTTATRSTEDTNPIGSPPTYDFRPGEPSLGSFPRVEWARSLRRTMSDAPDEAFGYGDPRGRLELRNALADYLARVRGVHLEADAIRIYAGFTSSLGFFGEMFMRQGIDRIAVEQPMLPFHRQILEMVGLETFPIRVDHQGLRVDDLAAADVRAVLVTPANQQPLGITMSSARRTSLIEWARSTDGWVVEDDYDGEFRYERRPIGALQGLARDRVLYSGTASKSMGPGLHLSWLVVPQGLRRDLAAVTQLRAGVSTISQLALADFLDRGALDRHVRLQRRSYARRREALGERLRDVPWMHVRSGEAGMHLVADLDPNVPEGGLIQAAATNSIGLIGLQTHFAHDEPALVINVSRPANHHFAAATEALLSFLGRDTTFM